MPRSIKAQSSYSDTLRIAIKRNGFLTQRALAERAGYSLATVKKFLGCKPVDFATFTELCETLNLDWEEIADLGEGLAPKAAQERAAQEKASDPTLPSTTEPAKGPPAKTSCAQDWGAAVDVSMFCGREQALETLEDWVVRDRTRLIALAGIGGIGKTTLTAKLAHRIEGQFDYLIWRSLKNAPPIHELMTNLLTFFIEQSAIALPKNEVPDTFDEQLRQLINGMRAHRCLIVLDNVEPLFEAGDSPTQRLGQLAGTYRKGYESYGDLFKTIGETDHSSCLIVTSRELPKEIALQAGAAQPTRCFQLSGLGESDGKALIQTLGTLTGTPAEWQQLIQAYSGNPLALKMIAAAVRDYFDGDISSFLSLSKEESLLFGDIKQLLLRQINRLTALEKDMMYWLAINREPVAWQTLRADLAKTVPLNKVLQAIDSLERRSLIEKNGSQITQQAVIMDYFTGELIAQVCSDITCQKQDFLQRYALVKANARDYIRQAQTRLILAPIVENLREDYSSTETLTAALKEAISLAREHSAGSSAGGYVGGNILTLLRYLKVDLTGYDFSDLTVWQAYLQGLNLYDVNFSGSDLSRSVFNQPFGSIRTMAFSPGGELLATGDTNSEIWIWQTDLSPTSGDITAHTSTFQGHGNWVCSVAFSPDGTQLVSGSADRTIKLWDVATGECLKTLEGHSNWVMSVAFSPDGTQLVSGSADRTIKLWNVETSDCLETLEGHRHGVWSVAFSPDGTQLVSGSADRTIQCWDIKTGQCIKTLTGHEHGVWSVAFSPDGQTLASGSADQTVRVWDVKTGTCQQTFVGHSNWVWMVAFSPDGQMLASGSADQTVRVWTLLDNQQQCLKVLSGHGNWVWSVAFSPDGNYLASGSEDRTMRLWELSRGKCLKNLQGSSNWVWSVAFSPDGQMLASGQGDRMVHLWDLPSGTPSETLAGAQSAIWSVAFSPDGNLLASGNEDGNVYLWPLDKTQQPRTRRSLSGHSKSIWTVAFSPTGDTIASGSADQSIKLWDVNSRKCRHTFTDHQHWVCSVAFHPKENILASGSYDRTIKLWNLDTNDCIETWKGHTSGLWCIAFSPKGDFLVSGSIDQTVRVWDVKTGACQQVLMGHENWVMAVAISPDGKWIASGSADHTVRLWSAKTGKLTHTLKGHTNSVWSVAFSPDGKECVSGSDDKTIRRWEIKTGNCIDTLKNKEPYEGMSITGATGLTESELSTLEQLGAITLR
ncbi:MAG: NB-ARC domain-containing protein [Cyanobacteria bacterium J06627_28]